ncbi:MAG: glycosyltransferase family 2 protein [Sulfolobales archaeon]
MRHRVALIILNYNGLKGLGNILFRSIDSALQIDYPDLDIVVIDNGSTDNSVEEIESRYRGDIILIKLSKNYGYAGGNERGFRKYIEQRGMPDYVVIMNNDYIVKNSSFLKSILKQMNSRRDIVIAQGINLQADGNRIECVGNFFDVMLQQVERCGDLKPSECPEKPSYVSYAIGSLMIVKLKPVMEVRGRLFREELFLLWEETELALNMWSHGFKTIAIPEVVGIHMGSATVKKTMDLAWYVGKRNKHLIYRRTLSPYLRSRYLYMPLISEISGLYIRILQGSRGRIATRGLIDSFFTKELSKIARGPYEPLLLAPKSWLAIHNLLLASSKKLLKRYGYLVRLNTLVVDDERLRNTIKPFLIKI